MPPKAQAKNSKADIKKKEKIAEDKTFGLKNKKGAKTQKYIQNVQKNTLGNQAALAKKDPTKKDKAKEKVDELNQIFKPVQPIQKIEAGVNPKSVLCAFFKQNQCTKGDKCKFSHDLTLARKSATRNYYEEGKEGDKMEDWDEEKLKEVVEKKHGEMDRKMPKTDIICKFFLDALEQNKYGWFWECPNGADKCHYRHVLPVGFVLKRDMKKEKKEEISIEELVERERAALGYDLPKINLTSFVAWKKAKIEEKKQKAAAVADKKKADMKAGKTVALSGREMFTLNPEMLQEEQMEDGEATFDASTREDLEEIEGKEIDLEKLAAEAQEVDASAPVTQRAKDGDSSTKAEPQGASAAAAAAAVPINEDLFDDLSDEALSEVDDQLDQLDLNSEK